MVYLLIGNIIVFFYLCGITLFLPSFGITLSVLVLFYKYIIISSADPLKVMCYLFFGFLIIVVIYYYYYHFYCYYYFYYYFFDIYLFIWVGIWVVVWSGLVWHCCNFSNPFCGASPEVLGFLEVSLVSFEAVRTNMSILNSFLHLFFPYSFSWISGSPCVNLMCSILLCTGMVATKGRGNHLKIYVHWRCLEQYVKELMCNIPDTPLVFGCLGTW